MPGMPWDPSMVGQPNGQLTYQQFLALRGQGQGAQQPQQPGAGMPTNIFGSGGAGGIGGWLSKGSSGGGVPFGANPGDTVANVPDLSIPGFGQGGVVGGGADPAAAAAGEPIAGVGAGPLAAIIAGTALGGRYATRALQGKTKNWKDAGLADNAGRATLGIATGGLSEVANKLFGGHKSTRQVQKGVTEDLLSQSNDPTYQALVRGMREQFNSGPPDPSHPFSDSQGNKFATFDEFQKHGLDAKVLTGTEGNLSLGDRYAHLTPEQQLQVTQGLIDAGQYYPSKGGVKIKDQSVGNQLIDSVLKGDSGSIKTKDPSVGNQLIDSVVKGNPGSIKIPLKPATGQNLIINPDPGFNNSGVSFQQPLQMFPANKSVSAQKIMIPRTQTRSPGIGLDGRRISY
jgi:hypothetical protein